MRVHRPASKPWDAFKMPPKWATDIPDDEDLVTEPHLSAVALLQAALRMASAALRCKHGADGDVADEVFEKPSCTSAFLARMSLLRCGELADLLAAYRIALNRESSDDPFCDDG